MSVRGITLINPVVNSVPTSIAIGRKGIDDNGRSLSMGLKADNDVVSSFLGQGLGDKATVLSKVLGNIGYSINVLRVAQDSLSSIAETLGCMLGVISQVGGSRAATRTLNDILQQKKAQVEQQIKSAKFDSRKLLTGDLGSNPTVRTKYNNKPVNVRTFTPGSFAAAGMVGTSSFNVTNNGNIATDSGGDLLTVGTVAFKFVDANPDYTKNQILKGSSEAETARNIVTAIRNNEDESLRAFNVSVSGSTVSISQRSAGSSSLVRILTIFASGDPVTILKPESATINFIGGADVATPANAGDSVTIGGITFTYTVAASATTMLVGLSRGESVTNLFNAVTAHPVINDLITRGVLLVQNAGGSLFLRTSVNLADLSLAVGNPLANSITTDLNPTEITRTITFPAGGSPNPSTVMIAGRIYTFNAVPLLPYALGDGSANGGIAAQLVYNALTDISSPLRPLIDQGFVTVTVAPGLSNVTIVSKVGDLLGAPDGGANHGDANTNFATIPNVTPLPPLPPPLAAKTGGGIDVSGIKNIDGFIGNLTPTFTLATQAITNGDGAAINLFNQLMGAAPLGATGNGDTTLVLTTTIAGRSF